MMKYIWENISIGQNQCNDDLTFVDVMLRTYLGDGCGRDSLVIELNALRDLFQL